MRQRPPKHQLKTQPHRQAPSSARDAIRVLLALVFILFASFASRDHDSPEKTQEAREIAAAAPARIKRQRTRESKRTTKLPEASILSRINGSI